MVNYREILMLHSLKYSQCSSIMMILLSTISRPLVGMTEENFSSVTVIVKYFENECKEVAWLAKPIAYGKRIR